MKMKVFVYGTLKKKFGNHEYFLGNSKFLGEFVTKEKFELKTGGFPYACREGEELHPVRGEVYEVDEATLLSLDGLEGVPYHYQRTPVTIEGLDKVEMYTVDTVNRENCPVIDGAYEWTRVN